MSQYKLQVRLTAGWVAGWGAGPVILVPLCGSILQDETCQIFSLAENPRWSPSVATNAKYKIIEYLNVLKISPKYEACKTKILIQIPRWGGHWYQYQYYSMNFHTDTGMELHTNTYSDTESYRYQMFYRYWYLVLKTTNTKTNTDARIHVSIFEDTYTRSLLVLVEHFLNVLHYVLYYTVLWCTVYFCTVMNYNVMYHTALLFCTVLYCVVLFFVLPHCIVYYCTDPLWGKVLEDFMEGFLADKAWWTLVLEIPAQTLYLQCCEPEIYSMIIPLDTIQQQWGKLLFNKGKLDQRVRTNPYPKILSYVPFHPQATLLTLIILTNFQNFFSHVWEGGRGGGE